MRLHLLAAGGRQPAWVNEGVETYAGRMPRACSLELVEISAARRSKSSPRQRAVTAESDKILAAVPQKALVVALDENGTPWSTRELAKELDRWRLDYDDVAFLIGGPDGLSPECLKRAERHWSLSNLTLPHGLARVIVAEQLYRAWTIIQRHPYHRE